MVFSIAMAVFYLYRPYSFIDHSSTKIVCNKNNVGYDIGPSFFYVFAEKIDPLTDKNVRKLCEYSIINDFGDTYKTPAKVNYHLEAIYEQEGSWGDVILLSSTVFFLGLIIINSLSSFWQAEGASRILKKSIDSGQARVTNYVIAFIISSVIFHFFLKKPAKYIFCERQMASRSNDFKKSAYGFGWNRIQEEQDRMNYVLGQTFKKCLKKEGAK